jgi:hypothetical protein
LIVVKVFLVDVVVVVVFVVFVVNLIIGFVIFVVVVPGIRFCFRQLLNTLTIGKLPFLQKLP